MIVHSIKLLQSYLIPTMLLQTISEPLPEQQQLKTSNNNDNKYYLSVQMKQKEQQNAPLEFPTL